MGAPEKSYPADEAASQISHRLYNKCCCAITAWQTHTFSSEFIEILEKLSRPLPLVNPLGVGRLTGFTHSSCLWQRRDRLAQQSSKADETIPGTLKLFHVRDARALHVEWRCTTERVPNIHRSRHFN